MQPQPQLNGYLDMDLLRFTTAGSVDDGKSTLIGRLLYDSKSIFEDQLEAIESSSKRKGLAHIDLSLLTDGLRAEREQGITIDVAYRYFATPRRKFIIADTPGHIQYTRNMVTGASTANLALILIDARKGVIEQTCRHSYIASLLKIPHLVVCVNKMDLVGYDEKIFENIVAEFRNFAAKLEVTDIRYLPMSALNGDNVVEKSMNMPWYNGNPLLSLLENVPIENDYNLTDGRFPVQYVIRPHAENFHDYRGYAGRIAGGIFHKGDKVMVLPAGITTAIKSIDFFENELKEAFPPMSVTITLADDIDISRGDMIVSENNVPQTNQDIDAMLCWFNPRKMLLNGKYALKHTTKNVRCIIKEVKYKVDINSLQKIEAVQGLGMNDIARVALRTTAPLFCDSYYRNRTTGSFILTDEATHETVAAGMMV